MRRLERDYPTTIEALWELWATPEGIESWWGPEGFAVTVQKLDFRPRGELLYTLTAVGAEQIEFLERAGMPLATESRKRFIEVASPRRLTYESLTDFIPGIVPYEFRTEVDLLRRVDGSTLVMDIEPMHDADWTDRVVAGRAEELEKLAAVVGRGG